MEAEVSIPDGKECTVQVEVQAETKVTAAALLLLDAVNRGGIPAFMTANLKQIASENGITVNEGTTPNEIIEAIHLKLIAK